VTSKAARTRERGRTTDSYGFRSNRCGNETRGDAELRGAVPPTCPFSRSLEVNSG
jgi:hypothetical protein